LGLCGHEALRAPALYPEGTQEPDKAAGPGPSPLAGFREALDDDLNSSRAFGFLFDAARLLNRAVAEGDRAGAARLAGQVATMGGVLGLRLSEPGALAESLSGLRKGQGLSEREIEGLVSEREAARKRKDWAEADRIRDQLSQAGVALEDRGGRTTWRLA
jgi:cysteinyl-tRNA synthetase